jgi:endonuclease/exonuclease/phosphatase family metal-dependent hydrolase
MVRNLRLATWNCRMALDSKRAMVERLSADVVVIQECAGDNQMQHELGVSSAWHGAYEPKGLGVFAFGGWSVVPLDSEHARPWSLPVAVFDPAGKEVVTLVAVWTMGPTRSGGLSYAEQVDDLIGQWEPELRAGTVVMAGDFNCSPQTANALPHLANVARLDECGVRSAYHAHRGIDAGDETEMTLRWVGRGGVPSWFHCDLVFIHDRIASRVGAVEIGTPEEWIGPGKSDHAPVIVDIGP